MTDIPPIDEASLPPIASPWPPAGDPEFVFVLEKMRFDASMKETIVEAASSYLTVAKTRGWKRLALANQLTSNPRELIQIWQSPFPYPGKPDDNDETNDPAELKALQKYRKFVEGLADFERTIIAPVSYDPGETRQILHKLETLLLVQAQVRDGAMARLVQLKKDFFKPTVEATHNWTLLCAGYVVSSSRPGSTIVQCWKLPGPTSLPDAMASMGQNGNYRKYVGPCIAQENQQLFSCISGAS